MPAGFGDDGDVALQQHGHAELVGQPTGGGDPVGARRVPGQPGELAGVRRQHGRRAAVADQVGVRGQDRQRVGVDDHRQVGVEREPQRRGTGLVGAQPGADDPGLHPARRARRWARRSPPASANHLLRQRFPHSAPCPDVAATAAPVHRMAAPG